jgi:integrase
MKMTEVQTENQTYYNVGSNSTVDEYGSQFKLKKVKFALSRVQRDELKATALKTNYRHYLAIRTQLELGLRINELVNLTCNSVNFEMLIVTIESTHGDRYKKAFKTKSLAGNRIIPLEEKLAEELRGFIGSRKNSYIFESNKGKTRYTTSSVIRFVNKYAMMSKSIGIKIGTHSLRRTFASQMAKKNIPIGKLAKMLGHKDIRTTYRYLYEIDDLEGYDDVRKAIKSMNKKA